MKTTISRAVVLSPVFFLVALALTAPRIHWGAESSTTVETRTERTKPLTAAGTTIETTTIETETKGVQPAPKPVAPQPTPPKPVAQKKRRGAARPETTVTTTEVIIETRPRAVYAPKTMKKMAKAGALCVRGFRAFAGNTRKNVCSVRAATPDTAYTCVWKDQGAPAFEGSPSGPCLLDYSEHRGNMPMDRAHYKSGPPFAYGSDVECCFRSAEGTEVVRKEIKVK